LPTAQAPRGAYFSRRLSGVAVMDISALRTARFTRTPLPRYEAYVKLTDKERWTKALAYFKHPRVMWMSIRGDEYKRDPIIALAALFKQRVRVEDLPDDLTRTNPSFFKALSNTFDPNRPTAEASELRAWLRSFYDWNTAAKLIEAFRGSHPTPVGGQAMARLPPALQFEDMA